MTITEKTAHLKGLLEGMDFDPGTKEGKLFAAIVDTLNDIAAEVTDLGDELSAVDEDLSALEEDFYSDECCSDSCSCHGDDDDEDEEFYEVECPNCGNTIYMDEDLLLEGSIECPECGETVELEVEEDGGDDQQ